MTKSKLKIMREKAEWTVEELAEKAAWYQDRKTPSLGVLMHFQRSIRIIEGENVVGPKPRKTYEYKNIAQALKCSVEVIYGNE